MKKLLLFGAIAISTATFAQVPNYVPTNGLVGWWPFNGNANDESGNNWNGTVNGATLTNDRFGNSSQAYSFDGADDFISTNNIGPTGASSRSISFWAKNIQLFSNGSEGMDAFSYGGSGTGASFEVSLNHNCEGLTVDLYNGVNTKAAVTTDNIWHHYVICFNNSLGSSFTAISYYQDGNLLSTICAPGAAAIINTSSANNATIGCYWNQSIRFFNGVLDDMGIWNRALTECEIQDLYNSQLNSATGISAGTDQSVCEGNDVTLSGTGGSNYQWSNSVVDGTPFTPTATQDYIVIAEDGNGCLGTDTVNVEVLLNTTATQTETALDSYTWPVNNQTYTQSGTYIAVILNAAGCDSTITLNLTLDFTGIGENKANFLAIYPNPTTSFLTIEGEGIQNKEFALVDIQGRFVLKGTFKSNKETIDLNTLARGQYLLKIEGKELKVVKE